MEGINLDEVSIRLVIWIVENFLKILFGFGIFFTVLKLIFIVKSIKILVYFTMILYSDKFKTHIFFRRSRQVFNKIYDMEIHVSEYKLEITRHILLVEYKMLIDYINTGLLVFLKPKKNIKWYDILNLYETDVEVFRDFMIKMLNVMKRLSLRGLEAHEIPEPIILKYKKFRNIIYDPIDQTINTICNEYKFMPLVIWSFLNFSYIYFTQLKNIISYFIESLNGEFKDIKYDPPYIDLQKEFLDGQDDIIKQLNERN